MCVESRWMIHGIELSTDQSTLHVMICADSGWAIAFVRTGVINNAMQVIQVIHCFELRIAMKIPREVQVNQRIRVTDVRLPDAKLPRFLFTIETRQNDDDILTQRIEPIL